MDNHVQFWDWANLESAFQRFDVRIHPAGLRSYLAGGRTLIDAFCYVPRNPYQPESRDWLVRKLKQLGFFVRSKVGQKRPNGKFKCDFDVEMTCDILRIVERARPAAIVVCSGDRDMLPVYRIVRDQGIRVEVAATQANAARDLLDAASSFIDLGKAIVEQRERINRAHGNGAADDAPRLL